MRSCKVCSICGRASSKSAVVPAGPGQTLHAVVGHSCGGVVAVQLLASRRTRVSQLRARRYGGSCLNPCATACCWHGRRWHIWRICLLGVLAASCAAYRCRTIWPARGSAPWSILFRALWAPEKSVCFGRISTRSYLRSRTARRYYSMDSRIAPCR